MEYDPSGKLLRYVFKDGREANFGYDENGNLVSITPPGRTAHLFEFDNADKKTGYKPPEVDNDSLNFIKYFYNQDGSLTRTLFPDNSEIEMIYDTDGAGNTTGRVKTILYNNGTITYNYNTVTGQITEVSTSHGDTLSYTYDGSLPTSETWSGNVNGTVGLAYNNDFRVAEQTINSANAVTFEYDDDGLMTRAGDLTMSYNAATGQLVSDTLGNVTSSYEYSDFGELEKYTAKYNSTILFQTEYVRDALGRITQLTETVEDSTKVFNYIYDTSGRLVEVKKNGVTASEYDYDANGNRLAKVVGIDSTKGIYDEQDRLLEYGNKKYGYDKNGYITAVVEGADTTHYAYDNLGNLTTVLLPNGSAIDYLTDANNRRVAKRFNGITTNQWIYSGELTPAAELDTLGNVTSRFVYGSKSNIPDYYVSNDTTYKIISDHLGSLRLVINIATGEIKQQINYDEFGSVLLNNGNADVPFGYAGGLYEPSTNLVRFGARDYSADVGRWSAKDPMIFDAGGYNIYSYVLNEPVNVIDNNGKIPSGIVQNALLGLVTATATNLGTQYLLNGGKIDIGELVTQALVGLGTGATFGYLGSEVITPTKNTGKMITNSMYGLLGGVGIGTFSYIADAAYRGKLDPNSIVPYLGGLAGMCSGLIMSSNDPDLIIMGMNIIMQVTIQVGLQVYKVKNDRILKLYN